MTPAFVCGVLVSLSVCKCAHTKHKRVRPCLSPCARVCLVVRGRRCCWSWSRTGHPCRRCSRTSAHAQTCPSRLSWRPGSKAAGSALTLPRACTTLSRVRLPPPPCPASAPRACPALDAAEHLRGGKCFMLSRVLGERSSAWRFDAGRPCCFFVQGCGPSGKQSSHRTGDHGWRSS